VQTPCRSLSAVAHSKTIRLCVDFVYDISALFSESCVQLRLAFSVYASPLVPIARVLLVELLEQLLGQIELHHYLTMQFQQVGVGEQLLILLDPRHRTNLSEHYHMQITVRRGGAHLDLFGVE
jgi:hypothetical protein